MSGKTLFSKRGVSFSFSFALFFALLSIYLKLEGGGGGLCSIGSLLESTAFSSY